MTRPETDMELPPPYGYVDTSTAPYEEWLKPEDGDPAHPAHVPVFTADQMRAHAHAECERCAKLCDAHAAASSQNEGFEGNEHCTDQRKTAEELAAAIRGQET